MSVISDNTPILIGVGQYVNRQIPTPESIGSPIDVVVEAARRALADTGAGGGVCAALDRLTISRFFEHSTRRRAMVSHPFGSSSNVPWSVANRLSVRPRQLAYAAVGGQWPQRLVNQYCEEIFAGEMDVALIAGGEAIANIKHAVRHGFELDWREDPDGAFEDPGVDMDMVTDHEAAHGLFLPLMAYPLFENAWRHKHGFSVLKYREKIGELFAPFTEVAANNPFAQFPRQQSASELARISDDNYLISEPYAKWHVSQDAVNQSAAIVIASVGKARELGVPQSRWVYLRSYADLDDVHCSKRMDLTNSYAQRCAIKHAMTSCDLRHEDIDHLDIYSCFPIAVISACEALGIDPFENSKRLTLTGGLPFFGGPGNNYSMHAIAEVVTNIRKAPTSRGMVIANGGYLTKHSVGIYAGDIDEPWKPLDSAAAKAQFQRAKQVRIATNPNPRGRVESYVGLVKRGEVQQGFVFARQADGQRFIAKAREDDHSTLNALLGPEPIEREIEVSQGEPSNIFHFGR
ncbi:MAG: acetyl-CoA acetyltransferase [Pseudomonadota bacterium]